MVTLLIIGLVLVVLIVIVVVAIGIRASGKSEQGRRPRLARMPRIGRTGPDEPAEPDPVPEPAPAFRSRERADDVKPARWDEMSDDDFWATMSSGDDFETLRRTGFGEIPPVPADGQPSNGAPSVAAPEPGPAPVAADARAGVPADARAPESRARRRRGARRTAEPAAPSPADGRRRGTADQQPVGGADPNSAEPIADPGLAMLASLGDDTGTRRAPVAQAAADSRPAPDPDLPARATGGRDPGGQSVGGQNMGDPYSATRAAGGGRDSGAPSVGRVTSPGFDAFADSNPPLPQRTPTGSFTSPMSGLGGSPSPAAPRPGSPLPGDPRPDTPAEPEPDAARYRTAHEVAGQPTAMFRRDDYPSSPSIDTGGDAPTYTGRRRRRGRPSDADTNPDVPREPTGSHTRPAAARPENGGYPGGPAHPGNGPGRATGPHTPEAGFAQQSPYPAAPERRDDQPSGPYPNGSYSGGAYSNESYAGQAYPPPVAPRFPTSNAYGAPTSGPLPEVPGQADPAPRPADPQSTYPMPRIELDDERRPPEQAGYPQPGYPQGGYPQPGAAPRPPVWSDAGRSGFPPAPDDPPRYGAGGPHGPSGR